MKDDIFGLVFCGVIFLFLLMLSLILRSGRGVNLINFYLFLPPEKKALYNEKALCRFTGNLLLVVAFYLVLVVAAGIFEVTWLIILLTIILLIVSISATIYSFTDKKFRK